MCTLLARLHVSVYSDYGYNVHVYVTSYPGLPPRLYLAAVGTILRSCEIKSEREAWVRSYIHVGVSVYLNCVLVHVQVEETKPRKTRVLVHY